MASRLNPYLDFAGDARQAMEFYAEVFGGTLRITTFGEFGERDPDRADEVMHAMLETDAGYALMASDLPAGMEHRPGENIAIILSGADASVLRGCWEQLSSSGTVTMPLERQMWGDEFGMCVDRFGAPWMVDIAQA